MGVMKTILGSNLGFKEIASNIGKESKKVAEKYTTGRIINKNGGNWQDTPIGKRFGINVDTDGFVSKEITGKHKLHSLILNDKGETSYKRIAGIAAGTGLAGYAGISSVGRIASGGGLYRDADGNFDLMGIPVF